MSVPLHWAADGLPIGVHFAGRYGEEATLLALAAEWRRRNGGSTACPRCKEPMEPSNRSMTGLRALGGAMQPNPCPADPIRGLAPSSLPTALRLVPARRGRELAHVSAIRPPVFSTQSGPTAVMSQQLASLTALIRAERVGSLGLRHPDPQAHAPITICPTWPWPSRDGLRPSATPQAHRGDDRCLFRATPRHRSRRGTRPAR